MFRVLPPFGADQRGVAEVVNGIMNGKTNNTGTITLNTGNATTTTLYDERISVDTKILLIPFSDAAEQDTAPYGEFQDLSYTTLSGNINSSVTTVPVVSTSGFRSAGVIRINNEIISYTGKTSTSFTGCTRGDFGTSNASHSSGDFVHGSQALASGGSAAVKLNTTNLSNGISLVEESKITVANPGIYNFSWSAQINNNSSGIKNIYAWIKKNGTSVDGSNGLVSVHGSAGGIDGHTIIAWNYFVNLVANDYVEFWWSPTDQKLTIDSYEPVAPAPATAAVIVTVNHIAPQSYSNIYVSSQTSGSAVISHYANSTANKTYAYILIG
jgi:hypothetical protein